EDLAELLTVPHTLLVRREARIAGELSSLQHVAETREQAVVRGGDGNPAVRRAVRLVRDDARMRVPVALRFCVGDERALRDVDERRERAAEQGQFDALPLAARVATTQRGEDS